MVCHPVHRHRCASNAWFTGPWSPTSTPFAARASNRTIIPGVQKPHWLAPVSQNAAAHRARCCGSRPSSVVTLRPDTRLAGVTQETRGAPSTRTVQQPHWPCGLQPSFTDVQFNWSRKAPSSESPVLPIVTATPSSSNETESSTRSVSGRMFSAPPLNPRFVDVSLRVWGRSDRSLGEVVS